ncbi:hypothetical protein GRI69_05000 [Erythrobacter vulgaris]|uniref:Uncharacterized protein n=1 Tax=Qipengyuania vulgaris TaxID=291985 RepID=A0A844XNP6_9SPHN|nr:hypothetical protein [Qipengyuania vulgaris]MXO47611.1 hypothetical protein [Qipengyuania vulgaris]
MKKELPLHDATFDGLVLQGKGCTMFFSRTDGSGCEVHLGGVDALQMDDFREGNMVVFFGTTTREAPSNLTNLERLYTPPHMSASAEYHEKYASLRDRKISAVVAGELTLIEMEPAIGANLLATCEHVRLRAHGGGN